MTPCDLLKRAQAAQSRADHWANQLMRKIRREVTRNSDNKGEANDYFDECFIVHQSGDGLVFGYNDGNTPLADMDLEQVMQMDLRQFKSYVDKLRIA